MNQMLRERCESLTQQRDRQLAEVRRLEAELYEARRLLHNVYWDAVEERREMEDALLEQIKLAVDNAHDVRLREQPY